MRPFFACQHDCDVNGRLSFIAIIISRMAKKVLQCQGLVLILLTECIAVVQY